MSKICPYCRSAFECSNPRKVYCSSKCNKLAYVRRRYTADPAFKERMRKCWRDYGVETCPKCGSSKKRGQATCVRCRKVDKYMNVDEMKLDDENSIFSNPESVARMSVLAITAGNPAMTEAEVFEALKDMVDDVITVDMLKRIIKDIIDECKPKEA